MSGSFIFPRQLGLGLETEAEQTFASFVPGSNRPICELLRACNPLRDGYDNSIYLWSPLSSGKSHLLRAYCFYWQRQGIRIDYIDSAAATGKRFVLSSDGRAAGMAIDNIQTLEAGSPEEEALLSFFKESADLNRILLLSGDKMPTRLERLSEDLVTRLMSFYVFQLHPLRGESLKDFIRQRAERLGMRLNEESETFLLRHCVRQDIKLTGHLLTKLAITDQTLSVDSIKREIAVMHH